jgi:ferric-dicitrate binding protein FerR (iron transport regulator)
MDRTQSLISGYLDVELGDEEQAQLVAALKGDAAVVDRLAFHSFIHSQLLDWMSTPSECPVVALAQHIQPRPGIRMQTMSVIAASLLVAAGVFWIAYAIAARPVIVGQLTQAIGCRWASSQPAFSVGTLLEDGQELDLVAGNALITLVNGAQLRLEGPTTMRLVSASEAELIKGQIAAKVPTTARGFTVTSPLARFVDLGTAFTLKLDPEKSFLLHVFEGLVELQLDERFGAAAHQPLRVAEVRAVFFDVSTGEITAPQFEQGKQMPF